MFLLDEACKPIAEAFEPPYHVGGIWGLTMDELLRFTKHQTNLTQEEK